MDWSCLRIVSTDPLQRDDPWAGAGLDLGRRTLVLPCGAAVDAVLEIAATLLVASFALRAAFVITMGTGLNDIWTYHFAGTTFGFFMLGHLICLAARRWPLLARPTPGVVFLIGLFATMTFGGSYAGYDTARFWGSVLFFTLALPGLFEATKNVAWMNAVGDLSYPIYLIHTLVLYVIGPWLIANALPLSSLPAAEAGYVSIIVYLAVTTVVAAVIHRLIEVPVARAMHWLGHGRSKAVPVSTT